jgi:hypothetical protein
MCNTMPRLPAWTRSLLTRDIVYDLVGRRPWARPHCRCHSSNNLDCVRLKATVRRAHPAINLLQEGRAFKEGKDIDLEARVPPPKEMARRMAACSAAAAHGYSLFQQAEPPEL